MFRPIPPKYDISKLNEPLIKDTNCFAEVPGCFFLIILMFFATDLYQLYSKLNLLNQQADASHCGVHPYTENVARICKTIHGQESLINDRINFAIVPFTISFLALCMLAKIMYNKVVNSVHPHHKIAYRFFLENPQYPANKGEETTIDCPLKGRKTKKPIYVSFDYKKKPIQQAYSYKKLKAWFETEQGVRDPATNLDLRSPDISNFKLRF